MGEVVRNTDYGTEMAVTGTMPSQDVRIGQSIQGLMIRSQKATRNFNKCKCKILSLHFKLGLDFRKGHRF